jgi:phosphatidate cytidylyltransferase
MIGLIKPPTKRVNKMLKQRVITAIILAILFLSALFKLPAAGWTVLVALMVMQGAYEWSNLAKMHGAGKWGYILLMLLSFAALVWIYANCMAQQKHGIQILVYGISAVFWLLLVPAWFKGMLHTQNKWLLGVIGWVVLLPTALAMLDLRGEAPQPWWLLGVMAMVWVADIAAYFSGRKFGKNKLAPTISPGKTWEGVAGAMLGVLVYVVLVMNVSGLTQHYSLIVFAMAGVALSVMGDLFESAIKRQAGVKDSGTLLPGHGGLLDRIDALTSTLPIAALLLLLQKAA